MVVIVDGVPKLKRHKELFGSERARARIMVFKHASDPRKYASRTLGKADAAVRPLQ